MASCFLRTMWICVLSLFLINDASAQARPGKYNSQLWEISGNGLKKPSYLFGTMHISNKLAFHLGDSFYNAIRNVDVVGLEQDPELWQSAIPRMTLQSVDFQRYSANYTDDYLKESSFSYQGFKGNLRALLAKEPVMNNALLYRTEYGAADFEENTYLDLYIYQTGRKLGKAATGVEDFMTTERLSVEAQQDEVKAQKKQRTPARAYGQFDVVRGIQDAYRKGDLDALDSLNKFALGSEAFREKFLYLRNEIQAAAMDSIMRRKSLFVGVGAAHLPGKRGVIEILRKKGYTLRPIYMGEYDARQKEAIDSIRVPVAFSRQWAADSAFAVDAPGRMVPLDGSEVQTNYADMANGSFYLVTRMKTMPLYTGYTEARVLRIIDSLMYEAVPGKILSKKEITRDGYKGYDLTNRTRRGDMQRYNIFATPSEILVFKMGGTENYVAGPEAERFFGSIRLRTQAAEPTATAATYAPAEGGFALRFPVPPTRRYTRAAADQQPRLELEATDPATGDVYTLLRKDMYAFSFLEEDTFEASLMIESLLSDDDIGKLSRRKSGNYLGYASQDASIAAPSGEQIRARAIVQGPHEFLLAVRSRKPLPAHDAFFNSLQFTPTKLGAPVPVRDTFLRFDVSSPVRLNLDDDVATLISYARKGTNMMALLSQSGEDAYVQSPEQRYGNFIHEPSGEIITVTTSIFPEFYYYKDSAKFWRNELRDATADSDLYLSRAEPFRLPDGTIGYDITLTDTGSSRRIRKKFMLSGHTYYAIETVTDGKQDESEFVKTFFATAKPYGLTPGPGIFEPKTATFFSNYYSADTLVRKRARSATSSIYFGPAGFPKILEALAKLDPAAPDYYDMKVKWIAELGYLDDSSVAPRATLALDSIYHRSADTSMFQNAALQALARLRTPAATRLFKKLLTEDPPVFDNTDAMSFGNSGYEGLLSGFGDTLRLAATLFPELLQLAPIQDYKQPVISMLAKLVDSGYVQPESYRTQLPTFLFDARIAMKKQQAEDDLALQATHAAGDDDADSYNLQRIRSNQQDTSLGMLYDYAVLLMPFYAENPAIPKYFDRLLLTRQAELRARTALLMLRNRKPVPDAVWTGLSADKTYRSRLYTLLNRSGQPGLLQLPTAQRQQTLAESALRSALSDDADTLQFVAKRPATIKGTSGQVYVYKYKKRNEEDWTMALIGLQPNDATKYADSQELLRTGIEIDKQKPLDATINKELRRALIRRHPGGLQFYGGNYGLNSDWARMLQNTDREE